MASVLELTFCTIKIQQGTILINRYLLKLHDVSESYVEKFERLDQVDNNEALFIECMKEYEISDSIVWISYIWSRNTPDSSEGSGETYWNDKYVKLNPDNSMKFLEALVRF